MKHLKAIRRVLYITMGLNLVAMAVKLAAGYRTGALSLIADGYDSLFDAASNVIGLVGIYIAARPADRDHPYGHRKFETLTAIAISLLLFLTTWELLESAWADLRSPESIDPVINAWSFLSLIVSIGVHVIVVAYELRAGRRLKSDVLVADALHTKADIYISVAVIGGLIGVRLGYPIIDPLLAIAIAVLIAKIGIDIIRESSKTLLDGAIVPISEIERIVMGVRDVRACHYVRSRGHEDAIYVDLHVKVAPAMSTVQAHAIAHDVQHRLRAEIPAIQDVIVHMEPEDTPSTEAVTLIPVLRSLADEYRISVHDITARRVDEAYYVEMHVAMDGDLLLVQAHTMVNQLEDDAKARIKRLTEIVTHIEPAGEPEEPAYVSRSSAESVTRAIHDLVGEDYGTAAYHRLQVHPMGDNWAASLHLLLGGRMSLQQAHATSGELEERLRDAIPRLTRVIVHTEPARTADGESR